MDEQGNGTFPDMVECEKWWVQDKVLDEAALLRLSTGLSEMGVRNLDKSSVTAALMALVEKDEEIKRLGDEVSRQKGRIYNLEVTIGAVNNVADTYEVLRPSAMPHDKVVSMGILIDRLRSTLEEIASRPCYGILYNGKNFLKDTMCMNTGFVPENWCASCVARRALADEPNREESGDE